MKKIFLDMDGVLAVFPRKHGKYGTQRYKEKNFFNNLKAYSNIALVNELIRENPQKFFILSTSPNIEADSDKMEWLDRYLPNLLKENIFFNRPTISKADFVKNKFGEINENYILFDDYSLNLILWEQAGGTPIKRMLTNTDNRYVYVGMCFDRLSTFCKYIKALDKQGQTSFQK